MEPQGNNQTLYSRAAAAAEYALMLALIAAGLVLTLVAFRGQLIAAIERVGVAITTVG